MHDHPMRRLPPKEQPANVEGRAHLFFAGNEPIQLMAVSTTGCIAIQAPDAPVRVFNWYFRAKGQEFITVPPAAWITLWSCRAPWKTEQCGHITRLHANDCGLTSIDARALTHMWHLQCANNHLEQLDCSGMSRLRTLDCSGNALTHIDVDNCPALTQIRVGGNPGLFVSATELLARARGEPPRIRRHTHLTSTSLFDL